MLYDRKMQDCIPQLNAKPLTRCLTAQERNSITAWIRQVHFYIAELKLEHIKEHWQGICLKEIAEPGKAQYYKIPHDNIASALSVLFKALTSRRQKTGNDLTEQQTILQRISTCQTMGLHQGLAALDSQKMSSQENIAYQTILYCNIEQALDGVPLK